VTTGCPRLFAMFSASKRHMMSAAPPGANGTMIFSGLEGKVCACAAPPRPTKNPNAIAARVRMALINRGTPFIAFETIGRTASLRSISGPRRTGSDTRRPSRRLTTKCHSQLGFWKVLIHWIKKPIQWVSESEIAKTRGTSTLDSDDMRLYLAVHGPRAERLGVGGRAAVVRFAESGGVARLDLAAQRRALAVGDRRIARGRGSAAPRDRFDLRRRGKPAAAKVAFDLCAVVITMRRARHETPQVLRIHRGPTARLNNGATILLS